MNVSQSKTNCLYQLHLLQQKQQSLNLKSKMYLEYLNQIILRKKVEFQLNQQISQSFNILLTEDKINNLKIHYEKFLINKLEVLNLIDKDYIQLEQLQQLALQLLKSKQQLQVLKHEIQKKQRNNHLFVKMIPLLQKSIGFNLKQDNENQANYFEGSQNLYHQQYLNQASALISLNKDGISSLLKASQNFCDIFEISSPQGLDIYDFIPLELQKEHKQLICQYFQQYSAGIVQQQRDQIEAKQRMNFVIGQTSQGFCIPLKIQFSIEQISSVNEIAAFATFTPINLSSYFIISDVISSKIRFVSKNFQSLYLNNVIDSQKLQQTEIQSFLPILKIQQITKNIINDDEISSYAILPTQEYFSRNVVYSYQNLIDILSNQQFNQNIFQIFKVNLKVHHLKLIKNSTFQTIQIYSMTIIQQQQEQAVAFNQLKQLLKKSQSLSPNCINETKQKAKISNILDSPDNHVSSANTTVLCPQQKQLYVNSLHQNLPSTGQFLDTEENNQNSCRSKNNQKTIVDIVDSNYLKMNSQRSSLLTIKMNKNSLTTANTFQDYVQIQQQFNKSYLDFILNQLYPNSTYRDSDEVNQQINFSKPIDGVIEIQPSFEQMQNSINENQRYQIQHSLQPTSNKVDENVIKINPGYSIQSQLLIKQASNNESSLFYVQNNDQKNKKDENENSSQNSGKTGHQIQIKTVYNKLSNKKLNKSLFVLSLFGLFTLFLIIGLSVFQFVEMINGLKSIQFDLHFVSWPASISSTCNEIWMYINLYLIQDSKIFPKLSESWINYSTDIEQKWVQLQKYGQYIYHDQIISDYDIGWYFLDITYRRNTYYIPKQDLPSTSVFKLIRYGDSELVFMQDYMANMYYYFLKIYDSQEAQLMLTENYQLMQYDLKFLDQQISNSSISVDVITVMVIVIALTFSQVLLTLPIYLYIQNEREFILKLFSTLQKQSIDKMKISCKESLQLLESTNTNLQQNSQKKQKDQRYKIFSLNNSIKRQSLLSEIENVNSRKTLAYQAMELNTKKKLISQTSQIKKMNFVLPLYGLAVFVIISIQPILNSVLVSTFKKDCITIFLGLDALFAMKDTLTKSIAFNYGNIYSKLADNKVSHLYNPLFFEQNLQSIFQEGQQNFMKMQNVANTIQQQSSNRNEYLEIITQIYEENICDLINQYPNMFKLENQIEFNFEQCNQIRGGILTQGFLVSSKYFLDQINDLFQIASIKDAQIRKIKFIQWEDGFNLKEFNTFYEYMSFIASFTQKIFLDNGYSKINDMWTIQYVLVSTQAFLVLIMYIFGWKKFFKVISSQLYKNKKIITLFEPDCIIENPYFMNYISKLK